MMKHIFKSLPWVVLSIFLAITSGQEAVGEASAQGLSFYKGPQPAITSYRYASLMGSVDNLTNSTSTGTASNGLVKCYLDKDSDGYGDINKIIVSKNPPENCVNSYNDCNDNNAKVNPKSKEICGDEIDQDCDGSDEVCSNDLDLDGDGMSESEGDCNDQDPTIYRGAYDICGDGIDQCCSGEDAVCPENHESISTIARSGSKNIIPDSKEDDSASEQSKKERRNSTLVTKKIKTDNRTVAIKSDTVTSNLKMSGSASKKSVLHIEKDKSIPKKSSRTLALEEIFLGFEENDLISKIALLSLDNTVADTEKSDPSKKIALRSKKTASGLRDTDFESTKTNSDFEQTILDYIESNPNAKPAPENDDLRSKEDDKDKDGTTISQGDCNDNDPEIYPGAFDECGDGIDQDCYDGDADCPDSSDYIAKNQSNSIGLIQNSGGDSGVNESTSREMPLEYKTTPEKQGPTYVNDDPNGKSISNSEPDYSDDISNPMPVYPDNISNSEPVPEKPALSGYGSIDQSEDEANLEDTDDIDGSVESQDDSAQSNSPSVPPIITPNNDSGDEDLDSDGVTKNEGDCNDNESAIHPGAKEICDDGIDQDCNGKDLACQTDPNNIDNDEDGFTENQNDCNDENPHINPGAEEVCDDGIDQNCNGENNEGCEEPPAPSEILPPELLSPMANRVMDNGCDVSDDGIKWDFNWSQSQGANRYEIEILHGEERAIISQATRSHSFSFECSGNSNEIPGCIIDHSNAEGWHWRVRAGNDSHGDSMWSNWSETRPFNVEPLNSDCGDGYDITLTDLYPESGTTLLTGDEVSVNFTYHVPGREDVRIISRPFSNGDPTPNQQIGQSPVYEAGDGQGENFFTILSGDRIRVDQIQFTIESVNGRILWRHFFDVDYEFNNANTIPDQGPENTDPTITPVGNQTTTVGTPLTVEFTIDDQETEPSDLIVSVRSRDRDQNIVPNDNNHIAVGGNGSNRFTTITPENAGSATITIRVNDGSASTEARFVLTVTSPSDSGDEAGSENTPPTISPIPFQTTTVDTPLTLEFTIDDRDTDLSELSVAATSNNSDVVSDDMIELGGNGANLSMTIRPRSEGSTTITITVSDGNESVRTHFDLEVTAGR
jgi:hypothetical protein